MRSVLSQRWTGLGDCLIAMISAWRYARATGRRLVIDWRGSCYAPPAQNAFLRFFEPPSELAGVPVALAPTALPGPWWPEGDMPARDNPALHASGRVHAPERFEVQRMEAVAMIKSGRDVTWPTVVFRGCLPVLPSPEECRLVLGSLRPKASILQAVEDFDAAYLRGRRVLGAHVRHGNGGDIMAHAKYWTPDLRPLDHSVRLLKETRARLGQHAVIFLCTDSAEVRRTLERELDGVLSRPKMFLPEGAGELHLVAGEETAEDALIEMLLLRRSHVLLRHPPDSYFSWWPSLYAEEVISPITFGHR